MRFLFSAVWAGLWIVSVSAQSSHPISNSQPSLPKSMVRERLVTFDAARMELRLVGTNWQIFHRDQLIKDFGPSEREAMAALQTIRELHLTQRGTVGEGPTGFEYWLANGDAPTPNGAGRTIVPFDPSKLEVRPIAGQWVLCDPAQLLFNFGVYREDAFAAQAVLAKYRFNQMAVIGLPRPQMIYFLRDERQLPQRMNPEVGKEMLLATLKTQGINLPNHGLVGERIPLDPRQTKVERDQNGYRLVLVEMMLAHFGMTEFPVRDFQRELLEQRVTEAIRLSPTLPLIYLSHGSALRRVPFGARVQRFDPSRLEVIALNGSFSLGMNRQPLLPAGNSCEEATLLLHVIRHFGYDTVASFGHPILGEARLFIRERW